MIEHKWSKSVIGARIGDNIYIHPDLVNYPALYEKVLAHELEHSSGYGARDFFHDLGDNSLKGVKKDYYKFLITHPSTWQSFSPIGRVARTWTVDTTLLIFYLFIISIFLGAYWLFG